MTFANTVFKRLVNSDGRSLIFQENHGKHLPILPYIFPTPRPSVVLCL
ncbi:hypothetical protein [uncultured Nostoc sp.]|nr:hypothetical protein [uncultured Nostoc sp.]